MFQFGNLSPTDFENLARDLIQVSEGLVFESFAIGPDSGIDFRFAAVDGDTIIQAKHYERSGFSKFKTACKAEVKKVQRLKPKRYILVSSVSFTASRKKDIQNIFKGIPLALGDIIGKEDLVNRLEQHPDVLKRHFKLWLTSSAVLERILKGALYERTEAELEQIKALVPRFVEHDGVTQAETLLSTHSTLIISGQPGIGKTTLARILIWLHLEQGWSIKVIDSIDEAFSAIDVQDASKNQLIFFDDFLGQVKVTEDIIRGTDSRLPPFLNKVKASKNLRFILATRDYIFHQARNQSERLNKLANEKSNYVLNIGSYPRRAKAQILFNHIYFSDLSDDDIQALIAEDFYLSIIDHQNFNPRIIEQITKNEVISKSGSSICETVQHVLDHPEELWEYPYRKHFNESDQVLMIAMAVCRQMTSIESLRTSYATIRAALNLDTSEYKAKLAFDQSLKSLEGTTLYIQDRYVRFVNPGVRDFMNSVLINDGLVEPLLREKPTFFLIRQLWELVKDTTKNSSSLEPWYAAIESSLAADNDVDPSDLVFILETLERKSITERGQKIILLALTALRMVPPRYLDTSDFQSILDKAQNIDLPENVLSNLVDTTAGALEHICEEGEIELTVYEASDFIDNVGNHDLAHKRMLYATHQVGEYVLNFISSELSSITTHEDLQNLRSEAEYLAGQISLFSSYDEGQFSEKEYAIQHALENASQSYQPISGTKLEAQSVDGEIRSLFSSLKQR